MPHTHVSSAATASTVTFHKAGPAALATAHFAAKLAFETDCSDVYQALQDIAAGRCAADFVFLDVRSVQAYRERHAQGALSLPHRQISDDTLAGFASGITFVVYCAGPHCNGADQAAWKIASRGYPVKLMIGGMTGWADEGLPFAGEAIHGAAPADTPGADLAVRCDCA